MSVLDKLSSALERNDERPNVELAEELAASSDKSVIRDDRTDDRHHCGVE